MGLSIRARAAPCPRGAARPATRIRISAFAHQTSAAPVAPVASTSEPVAPQRASVVPAAAARELVAPLAAVAFAPPAAAKPGAPRAAEPLSAADASSAVECAAGLLMAPYHAYVRALEARPLLTKAVTSCAGFMLGDLIAQQLGHHGGGAEAFDALRVARLGLYGLCLDGPLGALWYDWLEGAVWPDRPTAAKTVVAKTALDQLVYASAGTALFFAVITALEGHPDAAGAVVAAKFWPTLAANWAVWPVAHMVNFRWVPSQLRVAYNNVVAIGWLALLSAITHSHGPPLFNAALGHLAAGGH
ncbi:MAG: hypothetical protein J3K34DRAFT_437888 [Monoraphidium minutum]|nr:MAG: hypothetical protein J3K34DRAFT_437888 [Monoraphidium minutum]